MEDKINQTKLDFSCGAGTASVNLFTGNLLFEHADLSIGANSFNIGVSHIYNNRPEPGYLAAAAQNCGYKWKLNIQQYIKKDGLNYIYYDAAGYKREFINYDSVSESPYTVYKFYEKNNAATVLKIKKLANLFVESVIEDAQGNKLYFDASDRLERIVSCYNGSVSKKINYDGAGNIVRIYDERKSNRFIRFSYSNGLLSEAECVEGGKQHLKIRYNYENNNLKSIQEFVPAAERYTTLFDYDANSNLKYAVKLGTESALKIAYDGEKVSSIGTGIMKTVSVFEDAPALYVSSDTYCGQDSFPGFTSEFKGFKTGEDSQFNLKTSAGFTYNTESGVRNSTIVKNERGIAIDYFFNKQGYATGALEKDGNNYRTITKDAGVPIPMPQTDNGTINGSPISASGNDILIHSNTFNFGRNGEDDVRQYFFTCWIKLNTSVESAQLVLNHNNYSGYSHMDLDAGAYKAWQFVAIPMESYGTKEMDNIKLRVICDGNNPIDCSFQVANCRMTPGTQSSLRFEVTSQGHANTFANLENFDQVTIKYTDDSTLPLSLRKNAFYSGTSYKIINNDCYFTPADIFTCLKNMKKSPSGFDAVYCNRTKYIKNVKEITFKQSAFVQTYSIGFKSNNLAHCFFYEPGLDGQSYTKKYFTYNSDNIETKTEIKIKGADSNPDVVSYSFNVTDYSGKTLSETDAYDLKTKYMYNVYGDSKQIKQTGRKNIFQPQSSTNMIETVVYSAVYDSDNEYVLSSGGALSPTEYTYNTPFALTSTATNGGKSETVYNSFNDEVTKIKAYDNNVFKTANTMRYENGALKTVSDGYSKYGSRRGTANDETVFTAFDSLLNTETVIQKTRQTPYGAFTVFTNEYFRVSPQSSETEETYADVYGRVQSSRYNGAVTSSRIYLSGAESPSVQALSSVTDHEENTTCSYTYDHDGKLCAWESKDSNSNSRLKVQQISASETEYTFNGNENYKTMVTHDKEKSIAPKIKETGVSSMSAAFFGRDFNKKYDYDGLGRLTNVKSEYSFHNVDGASTQDTTRNTAQVSVYDEKNGLELPLVKNLNYTSSYYDSSWWLWWETRERLETELNYTYSYDERGNLTKIVETGKAYKAEKGSLAVDETISDIIPSYTRSAVVYGYDKLNRLTSEVNSGMSVNKTYEYDGSRLDHVTNNGAAQYYHYDGRGRLQKITTGSRTGPAAVSYGYDNYGNRTSDGKTYMWTRGNRLAAISGGISYGYNYQGVRSSKKSGNVTTTYYYDGGKLLGEDRSDGVKLRFFYDAGGICGFRYNGTDYVYVKDILGSVVMIMTDNCPVATYRYDALGNYTIENFSGSTVGTLNPIRWKGFYYDTESGMYYANGRYYDKSVGLYLDADDAENIFQNAGSVFGLDRNGISCNNIHSVTPYLYAIFTALELVKDSSIVAPEPEWWEKAIKSITEFWTGLHWAWKVGIGAGLFAAAVVLTVATKGAVAPLFIQTGVMIASGAVIGGIMSWGNGGSFLQGFIDGLVDGVFWGGVFAFITASIHAIMYAVNQAKIARMAAREATYQQQAIAARDAKVAEIRATGNKDYISEANVVVGGYDKVTGQIAVGVQKDAVASLGQKCAEDVLVANLGGPSNLKNIVITPAIRPRNLSIIPVCPDCQAKYAFTNFMAGTLFK